MAKSNDKQDLDAFFNAPAAGGPVDIKSAIQSLLGPEGRAEDPDAPREHAPHQEYAALPAATAEEEEIAAAGPAEQAPPGRPAAPRRKSGRKRRRRKHSSAAAGPDAGAGYGREGRFVALDPAAFEKQEAEASFVLIPANIHAHVPRWGWYAIGLSLAMLVAGVVFMPVWSLNRLASRLANENEADVYHAMRSLITNGDERTVRKLYDIAASDEEHLRTRLRAVDTMSLINGVPEVERSLLRLELAGGTNEQVREAAIAARRQRDAAATERNENGNGDGR